MRSAMPLDVLMEALSGNNPAGISCPPFPGGGSGALGEDRSVGRQIRGIHPRIHPRGPLPLLFDSFPKTWAVHLSHREANISTARLQKHR